MECNFPEHVLLMAYSRGIQTTRRPSETVTSFASRVMNIQKQHIRFTLTSKRLYAHYIYPDLLDRKPFEYALELKSMGISEQVLGTRVLPLDQTALYNILLFCKQSNPVHARVLLKSQAGARVAASWSYVPSAMTLLMLSGQYAAAVHQSIAGTPASLCNPNNFSIADFACKRATSEKDLHAAVSIIAGERLAPTSARTYRILLAKYKFIGQDTESFNQCIYECVMALRAKQLGVHPSDVCCVFDQLQECACARVACRRVRKLCAHILPLLMPYYLQIIFVPTLQTPWWFLQLVHAALLKYGVTFTRYMQSVQSLTIANATAVLLPFRSEYSARWPMKERRAASITYQSLLKIPLYTIWQASTIHLQSPLALWSPATHSRWPTTFQTAVRTVLTCSYAEGPANKLPPEILLLFFSFCFLHDFRL